MNYYPFHIGDYLSATRHLSWDEDCAYRRLLDIYYTNEKPLPLDVAKVCRLAVASTETQRAAVEAVLREFFVETPEGWTQKRIEDELAEMHMRQEAQEEREEGKQTRLQRFRLQRAEMFQALREVGIVAAWNIKMPELRQLWEQNKHRFPAPETPKNVSGSLYEETAPATAPETTTNASATTLPIPTPTPIPTPKEKDSGSADAGTTAPKTLSVNALVAEGVDRQRASDWLVLRRAKRLPLTVSAWDDTKAQGAKVGLTPAQTVEYAVSNNWAGFRANWYERDHPGGATQQAGSMGAFV